MGLADNAERAANAASAKAKAAGAKPAVVAQKAATAAKAVATAAKPAATPAKVTVTPAKAVTPAVGRVPAATTSSTPSAVVGRGAALTANAQKNVNGTNTFFADVNKNLGNFAKDVSTTVSNIVKDLGTDQQADKYKVSSSTAKNLSKGTTQQRLEAWAASKPKDVLWGNADFANSAKNYGLTSKDVSGYLTSNKVKNAPTGKSTAELQISAAAKDTSPVSKVARIGAYLTPGIGAGVSAGGVIGGSQKLASAKTDDQRNAAISEIGWNALGLAAGAAPKLIQTAKTANAAKVASPTAQAKAALKSGAKTMVKEDKAVVNAAKSVIKDAKKYTVTGEATKILKDATTTKSVTSANKIMKETKPDTGKVFDKYAVGTPTQQAEKIAGNSQADLMKGYDIGKEGKAASKGKGSGSGFEEMGGGVSRTGGGTPGAPSSGGATAGRYKFTARPGFSSGGNVAGSKVRPTQSVMGGAASTSKGGYGSAQRAQTLDRNLINNSWNTKSVAPQQLRSVNGESMGTVITKVEDGSTTIRGGRPPVDAATKARPRNPEVGRPGSPDGPPAPAPILPKNKPSLMSRLGESSLVPSFGAIPAALVNSPKVGSQFKTLNPPTTSDALANDPKVVNNPREDNGPDRLPALGPSSRPTPQPKPGPGPGNGNGGGPSTNTRTQDPAVTSSQPVRALPRIISASSATAGLGAIQSNWADYRQNYSTRVNTSTTVDPLHEAEAKAAANDAGTEYKPRSRSATFQQGATTYRVVP